MTGPEQSASKGHSEARTPPAGNSEPASGVLDDVLQAAGAAAAPALDLFSADDGADLLGRTARQVNERRRGAGRPLNSTNKRNDEMFDYLEARGFKAPELRLMEIITADPRELAAALTGPQAKPENVPFDKAMEVLRLQAKAAEALMPFKFAKKSEHKLQIDNNHLHVFVAGKLSDGQQATVKSGMTLVGDAEQYQELMDRQAGAVAQQPVAPNGQVIEGTAQKVDGASD